MIKAALIFEVVAVTEEAAKKSLEKHLKKLSEDRRVRVLKTEMSEVEKIENFSERIREAFSVIADAEIETNRFDNLLQIVIEFGPSSVELLSPDRIELSISEAQGILNSVSSVMHRFAAAGGTGGIIIVGD